MSVILVERNYTVSVKKKQLLKLDTDELRKKLFFYHLQEYGDAEEAEKIMGMSDSQLIVYFDEKGIEFLKQILTYHNDLDVNNIGLITNNVVAVKEGEHNMIAPFIPDYHPYERDYYDSLGSGEQKFIKENGWYKYILNILPKITFNYSKY